MIQYTINYYLNTISPKGRIAWEYNPLHNLRRTKDTDIHGLHYNQVKLYGNLYTLISTKIQNDQIIGKRYKDISGNTLTMNYSNNNLNTIYLNGENINKNDLIEYDSQDLIEAGSIVDLDTELLNFSLNNPVQIEAQPSYDGSVNLILNDDRNPPRLINTRFSAKELNTYEIVDRIGDNDTNIYDDDINQFDLDTSLYKKYNKIPKVRFNKVLTGGNLKVGNYVLYFRYCDADENETDFVAESGIIAIFKGNDKDPFSIDGGFVDMNAHKTIDVTLTNIDDAYDYIKVYYTRASSDLDQNRQITAHKLIKKFVVSRNQCNIILTGDEEEELVPTSELNSEYFIAETVKTQAQCQNMLFLGNVMRSDPLHQDLTDLSIRIYPYFERHNSKELIGFVSPENYIDLENIQTNYEYYNTKNIYYNVGYWNEEIYRIGVVYVMYDNTLSKVYNIRGCEKLPSKDDIDDNFTSYYTKPLDIFDNTGNRQYIEISEKDYSIVGGKYLENARGVVRFADFYNGGTFTDDQIYQLGIIIPEDVISYLKNYCKIKGLFFVRQKRIPTIMAQGLILPIDPEARVPLIYTNEANEATPGTAGPIEENFFEESFISQEKIKLRHSTMFRHSKYREKELIHDYDKRLIYPEETEKSRIQNSKCAAILCPEYEVRQQYYNQFFTGTEYPISYCKLQYGDIKAIPSRERFYTHNGYRTVSASEDYSTMTYAKLISVSEEVPTVAIGDEIFRGVCGTAQEAFRYKYAFKEGDKTKDDINLVRGIWHPYIGAVFQNKVNYGKVVNIYIPGYNISELANYYQIRYDDNSPYYPIGDRMGIDDLTTYEFNSKTGYKLQFFRGDCYLCTFTHRLNRNFQDPSAPANDTIVDKDSWANFDPEDQTTFDKINLGDVNAIKMGSWYTFRVRSNTNLSIRSLDESHLEEKGIFGLARGFYPLQQELLSGNNKIPDSYNVNDGFRGNFGEKIYLRYPDVPYIKNNYENRILYSQIAVNDAFRNGYRVFKSTHFNDYTKEYGSIIKLITLSSQGLQNGLLCIFEHGIGYIPVNERAVAGEGAGGSVFINTSNILPDNPRILSDQFGSQWQESIIQTPYYVYGVDTVAKKIWRTNGTQLEIISDFKMNKFLVDNITLTEKELTPIIGIRNVKTHYNANKSDVMFTFYDNQYGLEEKVWNLCWNEISQCFTTFYSWVPSYSENIDNIFFSFDRETSKAVAKLGTSQKGSTNADGIVLSNSVIEINSNVLDDIVIPNYSINNNNISISSYGDSSTPMRSNYDVYVVNTDGKRKYLRIPYESLVQLVKKHINSRFLCEPWPNNPSPKFTFFAGTEIVGLENRVLPESTNITFNITYEIEKDPYGNWRYFTLYDELEQTGNRNISHHMLKFCPTPTNEEISDLDPENYNQRKLNLFNSKKVWYVYIKANITVVNSNVSDYHVYRNSWTDENMKYDFGHYSSIVAITSKDVFNNYVKYDLDVDGNYKQIKTNDCEVLTSDFWKHGSSGIIDIKDDIQPCMWYGKQHPFEFEFVVRDTPNMHKVFDNLEIISNKAEPESFHFDVVGESYEFHNDKRNMYWRQEATKEYWQNLGINTTFDRKYTKITPSRNIKSTIFPLYYNRVDTYDNIYDSYTKITDINRDYRNLSGSEIIFDKQLNEYRIRTHIKNTPITQSWNEVSKSEWSRYPAQYTKVKFNNEIIFTQQWLNTSVKIGNTTKTITEWLESDIWPHNAEEFIYPTAYYVFKDTGRIRGNSHYKEDRWKIQIPSITFMQKNEHDYISGNVTRPTWTQDGKPPIVINYIPEDYPCTYISHDYLPNIYDMGQTKLQVSTVNGKIKNNWPDKNECAWEVDGRNVDNSMIDITPWTYRKETKIRDKYMRVRIRYEGHQLAVIQAVLTTYTESYA